MEAVGPHDLSYKTMDVVDLGFVHVSENLHMHKPLRNIDVCCHPCLSTIYAINLSHTRNVTAAMRKHNFVGLKV